MNLVSFKVHAYTQIGVKKMQHISLQDLLVLKSLCKVLRLGCIDPALDVLATLNAAFNRLSHFSRGSGYSYALQQSRINTLPLHRGVPSLF